MKAIARFLTRLGNTVTQRSGRQQSGYKRLQEEMQSHCAFQTEENIRNGMNHEEAARQARIKFGAVERIREDYHAQTSLPLLENLRSDVRYALRVLRKSPLFTAVAVLTLMLGIGANVVVFGVLNAVLLRPLAVCDPQSLYQLRHQAWTSGKLLTTSYPAFEDFRRRNTTFSGMAALDAYSRVQLRLHNTMLALAGDEVSGNYFDVLGVYPQTGRFFHATDVHGPNSAPYVVLSDALWRNAFHADKSIIGRTIDLNMHPFTVIGVASPRFHGTERFTWPDYWIPMVDEQQVDGYDSLDNRASVTVTVLGRLLPGVTARQATDNLNAIAAQLARRYPLTDEGVSMRLIHPGLYGDDGSAIRGFLWSVTALTLLVLAAACANLGSLFAARAADRGRELALRIALGSSRLRVAQQLLIEAVLVSLLGGATGLIGAALLLRTLNRWHSPYGHLAVTVDARVYFAAVALTLGSTLLFGLIPARQAWHSSPSQMMKGVLSGSSHLGRFTLRDILLGMQIAICTLLVTASMVAVRGMVQTLHAPLGFQPRGAMLADIDLSQTPPAAASTTDFRSGTHPESADPQAVRRKTILDAIESIPGVTAAGAVNRTPMTGGLHGIPIFPRGTTRFTLTNAVLAPYVFQMSPGYLAAAETPLLTGRDVSWRDTSETPYVAVVNQTFARRMWGRSLAVGRRFILYGHLTEVVGVAADGKYHDLQELPQPVAYVPFSQGGDDDATFIVRSRRTSSEMNAALEHILGSIAPNAPITVMPWVDSLSNELFPAQAATAALGVMGLLAVMLAITGIFGMAAYNVSRRMKELGIRVALGARRMQVLRAAIGRPMLLLTAGSLLGLLAAAFASSLLRHLVYQANPRNPLVVGSAVLTMALLGVAASAIPARRALAVDPCRLLREN